MRKALLERSALNALRTSEEEVRRRLARAVAEQKQLVAEYQVAQQKVQRQQNQFTVTALAGGRSGASRRATFLECGRDGATIQPQGILLSLARTDHDQQAFRAALSQTKYVVFLIRPDGYESFRRYRTLLVTGRQELDGTVELGCEPVNHDWVLEYPQADAATHILSHEHYTHAQSSASVF